MKLFNAILAVSCGALIVFSGCKKKDDDPVLFSKTVTGSNGLTVEMTWTVNGHSNGEDYVDLDLLIDNTSIGSGDYEYNSSSSSGTESTSIPSGATDGTYNLGVLYYDYETGTTSADATYTLTIYPTGNSSNSAVVTGTITNDKRANSKTYNKYTVTKSGTSYTIQEVSPVVELSNGYN